MTLKIPTCALFILYTLKQAGFAGFIVGGAVRDLLRQELHNSSEKVTDYDFTTNATPKEISQLFPDSFYENSFGTVSITHQELITQIGVKSLEFTPDTDTSAKQLDVTNITKLHPSLSEAKKEPNELLPPPYEITTYRTDGNYSDHRRPDEVSWGKTLEEDLNRRDFTINALALEIDQTFLENIFKNTRNLETEYSVNESNYTVIDPHNGLEDIKQHLIKTVRNPLDRFEEDALRLLRAIRFSVQLNMEIEKQTFQAISEKSQLLEHVSGERIRDEFLKMLSSQFPKEAILLLDETGLLKIILPELIKTKGIEQGGHHTTDVWTHSLDALAECPSPDPIVRLATLLHDISKPETQAFQNDTITFYNHEVLGSRVAKQIGHRLKLSNQQINKLFILVRYHMFHYQPENTDAAIRRFMRKVGLENINDILDLREADRLGSGARKTSWRLEEMKERMEAQLHQPFAITDLQINGNDLMTELNLQPGRKIGEILEHLFELVLENPDLNTKEQLLIEAKKIS